MTQFIQLFDNTPPLRAGPDAAYPWTLYLIESSVDGVDWAPFVGPNLLDPPVDDPDNPPTYHFTSIEAPDEAVYFRIVWRDAVDVELATAPITRPLQLPPWTPSVGDVAHKILIRTKIHNGTYANTFTDDTPVTASQANMLIRDAVREVAPLFDDPITDASTAGIAKDLAALRAAMLIELTLFAEQVNSEQSPYDRLKDLWDDATGGDGTGVGDGDDVIGRSGPSFFFPTYKTLMEPNSCLNEDENRAPGAESGVR